MINKKKLIISSVVALTLVAAVVGISTSKADSLKGKRDKPNVTIHFDGDADDDLANGIVTPNSDAADHGSVILPDGSSSKDIVLKDDDKVNPNGSTTSGKDSVNNSNGNNANINSDFNADSDDDLANGIVTPNSDAADHGSVILPDGSSSKDIVIKDNVNNNGSNVSKPSIYVDDTEFDADSDDDLANGIVTPNSDAADHGSVILPGGASSKDIVCR